MSSVRRQVTVGLSPQAAYGLWTDITRWSTFIDGFGHVERIDPNWPNEGARVVWKSPPAGRGIVTETVTHAEPPQRFTTQVFEDQLRGTQTVEFVPGAEPGTTTVALELEYTLQKGGPLRALIDAIFIRRSEGEALQRTLNRFATEAREQAAL